MRWKHMNNLLTTPQGEEQENGLNQPLKVTSLLYLKEALNAEAYEKCAEILGVAKEFGVPQEEITKAVQAHIVTLKARDLKVTNRVR